MMRQNSLALDMFVESKGCIIPVTQNPAQWMHDMPDASYLHDLLIPGAHNAIAGPQPLPNGVCVMMNTSWAC